MSGREMVRLLEEHGRETFKINASHHFMRKMNVDRYIVVPVHGSKELKPGTQRAILKQAGLK